MSDRITRIFKVKRGKTELEYVFETYSIIFQSKEFTEKSNYWKLQQYLKDVFMEGYPLRDGKESVSQMKELVLETTCIENSITKLLSSSGYYGAGNGQHAIAQKYLLNNDNATFAVEVPVWDEDVHGFIDVIRCLPDDKINIFDFKPNAIKETKAASQVRRYAQMLSKKTQIPMSDIVCSYGDGSHYFQLI